jgi:zinc transport system substrate-binding protein
LELTVDKKRFGLFLAGFLFAAAPACAAPRVVVSIAPIHSLVASVMEGAGEPELLIRPEVSPHDYALKPSDVRKLAGADLVVWVGPALETYLVKPLQTEGVPQLELLNAAGIDPHPFPEGVGHDHGQEAAAADGHDEHGHDELGLDPHIWLDPQRAEAIVKDVAQRLIAMDPENADLYEANEGLALAGLKALDSEIAARLAPLRSKPFVTFHDGYSYFVGRYGLQQVGQYSVHPEQLPGAASLKALRTMISDNGVACAFSEPQFDPALIQSLAGSAKISVGVLDPLGAGLQPGVSLYGDLLRKDAEAIAGCLSSTS